ncbi:MAG: YggS family pyridoxal phosphate-dependent enzyme [Myxococcales bacterium]|nr:YggS family pyridoxal phosphate-dependent enzyme [Myxococcales bacterium]
MSAIAERLVAIEARIVNACVRAGRPRQSVTCIAVSKLQPIAALAEVALAGQRDFGENYAQELAEKQVSLAALAGAEAAERVRWHYIGSLQRNKAGLIAGKVALVHAVDSLALAQALDRRAAIVGATQPILIAVNLGGETSKSGVAAEALAALLEAVQELAHVRVDGLMTMPPPAPLPEANRAYFAQLRQLRDAHASAARPLPALSMGMSDDFEVAIEEGATHVRIGSAIFGARPQQITIAPTSPTLA